jgi:hypothetical protein
MQDIVNEDSNITPPLKNTTGLKCIHVLRCTPTSQVVDLRTVFGLAQTSHFYTLQADGVKCYVAVSSNDQGSIDETALGNGATVCWPIPDGGQLPYRPIAGQELATGYATQASYPYLFYKSTATGYLRVYRSSVAPGQGVEQFRPPGIGTTL